MYILRENTIIFTDHFIQKVQPSPGRRLDNTGGGTTRLRGGTKSIWMETITLRLNPLCQSPTAVIYMVNHRLRLYKEIYIHVNLHE